MNSDSQHTGPITITRDELYRQVWKESMRKLAPQYGITDSGLAKICKRHGIPRPPVGYWSKLSFGHEVEATPLPELDEESLQEITIFRQQFFGASQDRTKEEIEDTVKVSERLNNPHPLVSKTKELLAKTQANEDGLLRVGGDGLVVRLSPKSAGRALRILDALLKEWERLGGQVTNRVKHDQTGLGFKLGEDTVEVEFFEETERFERKTSRYRYSRDWDYKPTGRLVLNIPSYSTGLRKRWADGKKQRLENVLGRFIECLQAWIVRERESRLDHECRDRQRTQAEKAKQERQKQQEAQEERRVQLERCAQSWEQSQLIRRYLAALEMSVESGRGTPSDPEGFAKWLEWAKWYADSLDPCIPTPEREEYVKPPLNIPVADLDLTKGTKKVVALLDAEDTDSLSVIDRKTIREVGSSCDNWGAWSEIGDVLEGLGYDVSSRERY